MRLGFYPDWIKATICRGNNSSLVIVFGMGSACIVNGEKVLEGFAALETAPYNVETLWNIVRKNEATFPESTKNIPVNLNDRIRVRLTDVGRKHLEDLYNEIMGERSAKFPYKEPKEVDGWTEFQVWDFMGKFGKFCQLPGVSDMPFEMDAEIVLEEE